MLKAGILIIGDEILSGNTLDTNSNFISQKFKNIGLVVSSIQVVQDEVGAIVEKLESLTRTCEVVVCTGGLGPTKDDRTRSALSDFIGRPLTIDPDAFAHLKERLTKRNLLHLLPLNMSQAEVIEGSQVLVNPYGTAPGQLIEFNNTLIFVLPGVPTELKRLVADQVVPIIQERFELNFIGSRSVSVVGIPESELSAKIEDWELSLGEKANLSYLPVGDRIKLKITVLGDKREVVETYLDAKVHELKPLISSNVIAWQGERIEEILGEILSMRKLTLACAESCTGGTIAKMVTSISGSSSYFLGSVVAYDYHQKINILGVDESLIREQTAVSAQVCEQMAIGVQKVMGSDVAIATTGAAGPTTDENHKEKGEAFYCIRVHDNSIVKRLMIPHFERDDFMDYVSQRAMQELVKIIQNNFS